MDFQSTGPSTIGQIAGFCQNLPPAAVVFLALLLVVATLWFGREAWSQSRVNDAIRNAPRGTSQLTGHGLVKLVGKARPPAPPAGYDPQTVVWRKSERRWSSGSTTSTQSINEFYLVDGDGRVRIDPAGLHVVPSETKVGPQFLDSNAGSTDRMIRSGDTIFALGTVEPVTAPGAESAYRLKPSDEGVFLVSGRSERETLVLFRITFWVLALLSGGALAATSALVALHLLPYPEPRLDHFVEALKGRPMASPAIEAVEPVPGPSTTAPAASSEAAPSASGTAPGSPRLAMDEQLSAAPPDEAAVNEATAAEKPVPAKKPPKKHPSH